MELSALERLKIPHRLIMGKTVLPVFLSCFWFKHIYFVFVCSIYIVFEIIQSEKDRNRSKMLMKFFSCKI